MTSDQMEAAYLAIRAEYNRCRAIFQREIPAPELYGIKPGADTIAYHGYRTEGLGYALDMIEAAKRGAPEVLSLLDNEKRIL